MLSGIGPAAHLKEKGIPVVCDLPGVGANLLDQVGVYVYFKQNGVVLSLSYLRPKKIWEKFKLLGAVIQYQLLNRGGPLAMNVGRSSFKNFVQITHLLAVCQFGEAAAFVRTDDPVLFPKSVYPEDLVDTTSTKESPDIELFMLPSASKVSRV
jgi:choline dehydrogenase